MYDTVHLFLPIDRAGGVHLPALIPNLLQDATTHTKHDKPESQQVSVSGHLGNLRVVAGGTGLSVQGSFCTYYHEGNKFSSLTHEGAKRAVEKLSDALGLPMSQAKVSRVDVGQALLTNHPPAAYYPGLGQCPRYNRLTQPESLHYKSTKHHLVFYDKKAEGKKARSQFPATWENRHVLRYESRFMSRLPKQFNRAELIAADLYEQRFYADIIDKWATGFTAIEKVSQVNSIINLHQIVKILEDSQQADRQLLFELLGIDTDQAGNSPKDFQQAGAQVLAKLLGGQSAVSELVEQKRLKGDYKNRTDLQRMRGYAKEVGSKLATVKDSPADDLMTELTAKVHEARQSATDRAD